MRRLPTRSQAHSLDELIALGTLTPHAARVLEGAVVSGLNVLVAGGTQAGKTTLDTYALWHTRWRDRSRPPSRLEGWCAGRRRHGPGRRLLPHLR